tara:strand:+ start:139 stop:582 length:444 start_codon:yes stop_codon:yes gene_type:complete
MKVSKENQSIDIYTQTNNTNFDRFQGKHLLLELYGCNSDKLNDEIFLRCKIDNASKLARASVLNLVSNKFEPFGVTAIALLAESHLSIHTWPESQYAAIDIFTCGKNMLPNVASQFLIDQLEATNHILKIINRDCPTYIENQTRTVL